MDTLHTDTPLSVTLTDTTNASRACLRREDEPLLRGQGQFVHHVTAPDLLHVIFIRSDKAQGQIQIQGLEQARTLPSIRAILTAKELGHCHMPAINPLLPITPEVHEQLKFSILAQDHVTYVGQPIGLIVGGSLEDCHQALALIEINYQNPPQKISDTPYKSNTPITHIEIGAASLTASAQDIADRVHDLIHPRLHHVQTQLNSPRVISAALEPRAVVARWDDTAKALEVRMGTQSPSRARSDIAKAAGVAESQVRVISTDVGGAFGAKASVYPEDLAITRAAVLLRASLKWTSTRMQEFASAMHGRGSTMTGRLAVNDEGLFIFLGAKLTFDLGAWVAFSGVVPLRNAARILPGPYSLKQLHVQGQAFLSSRAPVNIYRGAGRPEATLLMETLVDTAARKLGMDPVELRHLNLVREEQMPWQTPSGETLDSGNYPKLLEMACEAFGYQEQRSLQASRLAAGQCVGIGVAFYVEPCGQGWESARVTLHTNDHNGHCDHVTVSSGSPAQGQGHLTSFARIAAQALGCPIEKVTVIVGDTDKCPPGIGTLASRSTAIGGSAIVEACREVLKRQKAGQPLPLTAECRFESNEAWSAGCVIARVSIDLDTGEPCVEKMSWADDAGNIIDPELAHGQLIGGAAQGLGQALMEAIYYDSSGQLLTGSFMDYAIPRATDMPEINVVSQVTPSPNNLLGAKGVGEAGCIGVPAAIMNAVRDALSLVSGPDEFELSFPLTAEKIWLALNRGTAESPNT